MTYRYSNQGKGFELEVTIANRDYWRRRMALIQKIATPVQILSRKGVKVTGKLTKKSTLDFRGTLKPDISISFDCKETAEEKGLPLNNILPHQIAYMKNALEIGERTFILCYLSKHDKRFYIPGKTVIDIWDLWQENKGKVGYNFIPKDQMIEVKSEKGITLHYLKPLIEEIEAEQAALKENIKKK